MKEYALYKGEDLIAMGTASEIAKETGVKRTTIYHYKTPAYQRRAEKRKNSKSVRVLVELDDDGEE